MLPVNDLEREEDPDGHWRRYVNDQLSSGYRELFARLNLCVLLRAPSFEIIQYWRAEQEAGLQRSRHGSRLPMDPDALHRFISHYERLTRWMHRDELADLVVDLDAKRIPSVAVLAPPVRAPMAHSLKRRAQRIRCCRAIGARAQHAEARPPGQATQPWTCRLQYPYAAQSPRLPALSPLRSPRTRFLAG